MTKTKTKTKSMTKNKSVTKTNTETNNSNYYTQSNTTWQKCAKESKLICFCFPIMFLRSQKAWSTRHCQTNTTKIVTYQTINKLIQRQHFQFVGNPYMPLIFKSLRMFRLTFWSLSLKCFEIISKLMSSIAVLGENPRADFAWKIVGHYSQSFPTFSGVTINLCGQGRKPFFGGQH